MKMLLISRIFPPRKGGSGRWMFELYRRLPSGSTHIVAPDEPGARAFDQTHNLSTRRIPLPTSSWGLLHWRGLAEYCLALWRLWRECKRVRPDVVHCQTALPEGLLARGLKVLSGKPYVCYVHGEELMLARTSKELRWLTQQVLRGAKAIIANSQHTQRILGRDWGLGLTNIHVLHPGVDTSRFIPARESREARAQLGWEGHRVLLTVGALQKRKGQDMMIRALPIIRERYPDILYAIAGEGWEREYLEALVAEVGVQDCVQFRGIPSDEELIRCYQQCDLFVLANRQVGWDLEGFGIVLLEAQACGKPVLTGASGGTKETLDVGITGQVVPCERSETLAQAVIELLDQNKLREQMGQRGRQWVVDRFDWAVLSQQAQQLFGDMILAGDQGRNETK